MAVNENQRVDAALRDEPGGDDRLAKGSGCGQHAGVVGSIAVGRDFLFGAQFAVKVDLQRRARSSARPEQSAESQALTGVLHLVEAASRQAD